MSTFEDRVATALRFAHRARGKVKNWVELHNALFGMGGKCTELFPTETDRTAFIKTPAFQAITGLLDELREKGPPPPGAELSTKLARANGNISIRLPRSIHAALLAEAEAEDISLNQLCLAKLAVQLRAIV